MDEEMSRKELKSAKKQRSRNDRSKFKKTDRAHWEQQSQDASAQLLAKKGDLLQGRVCKIAPTSLTLLTDTATYTCTLGSRFKKEKTKQKNLIAVGDNVLFEPSNGKIASILPRHSLLSRSDHLRRRKEQILATNVDQVLITLSVQSPPLKPALIDRYLIAALKGNLHPVLVLNKIDLLQPGSPEEALFHKIVALYTALHIPVFPVSVLTHQGLDALKNHMAHKTSVFSGQSGVGKSSLINALTGLSLAIAPLRKLDKGIHTTTTAQLLPLPFGGWCVDTPGIRSFGLWDLTAEDLAAYFPDIWALAPHCHFPNCSHTHEPHCHVRDAAASGALSPLRYDSYLKLRDQLLNASLPPDLRL